MLSSLSAADDGQWRFFTAPVFLRPFLISRGPRVRGFWPVAVWARWPPGGNYRGPAADDLLILMHEPLAATARE